MGLKGFITGDVWGGAESQLIKLPGVAIELRSSSSPLLKKFTPLFSTHDFWEQQSPSEKVVFYVQYIQPDVDWRAWLPARHLRQVDQYGGMPSLVYSQDGFDAVEQRGLGVVFLPDQGPGLCLVQPPPAGIPENEQPNLASLSSIIMSYALWQVDKYLLHAGAVGRGGDCMLWSGASGSGKSTMVFRMADRGWDYYGDDLALVGRDEQGHWRVWPWWRPASLSRNTCQMIPSLAHLLPISPERGKFLVEITRVVKTAPPPCGFIKEINVLAPPGTEPEHDVEPGRAFQLVGPDFLHWFGQRLAKSVLEATVSLTYDIAVNLVPRDRYERN